MNNDYVCSQCGAVIGPGEYKLAFGRAPMITTDRPSEERIAWICRRCASRLVFDDDEEVDDDE